MAGDQPGERKERRKRESEKGGKERHEEEKREFKKGAIAGVLRMCSCT